MESNAGIQPPAENAGRLVVPTVVESIVKELRQLIITGEFAAGEPLREERLAERFGVSRPPLREALRVLQRDGIVIGKPRHGFTVIPISTKDAEEIYALRWILERGAIENALPVRDPALLIPLRDALTDMRDIADHDEPDAAERMVDANAHFHAALVALACNTRISAVYASLQMQIRLCMAVNLATRQQQYGDHHDAVQRHASLLQLIETGDVKATLDEMSHHGDRDFLGKLVPA